MLTILSWQGNALAQSSDPAILSGLIAGGTPFWLNFEKPAEGEFDILRTLFKFHPLAIEDAMRPHQRPKVDDYEGYFFLAADEASYEIAAKDGPSTEDEVQSRQIGMFLGLSYLITVDTSGARSITNLRERCLRHTEMMQHGMDRLLHAVLDTIVDGYFPIIDRLNEEMDALEDKVISVSEPGVLPDIFRMKKNLTRLRRMAGPLREVVQTLTTRNFPHIQDNTIPYLRDVADHLFRVYETLDGYRDLMSNMLDAYLTQLNNQMSRVMQRLSAVATVFMPITFLSGVFGMNFAREPWSNTNVWWWIALMAAVAAGTAAWFQRRRWF